MLLPSLDRQVITSWRKRALNRRPSGPRIAVVGPCQSFGVAYAMKLLDLEAEIDRFSIVSKSWTDTKMLARTLETYDYVFCQDFAPGYIRGGGSSETLRSELRKGIWFPLLIFTAYHPDLILVFDPTKRNSLVHCGTGHCHSALVFFAYRAGLPVEAALRLFRREVYEALGYFDVWEGAAAALIEQGRQYGLDLGADFVRWTNRGCFMYSVNHPKPYVMYDIARMLLRSVGRPSGPIDFDTYAVDDIVRGYVFPVYPEIAEFYGVSGSYIFKASHYRLSKTLGRFWDLPGYIQHCYEVYARHRPEQLADYRVKDWLADEATSKFLCDAAGAAERPVPAAA
jgi:hypothetical protein